MFRKLNLTARFDAYCFVSEVHVLSFSSCLEVYKPDNTHAPFLTRFLNQLRVVKMSQQSFPWLDNHEIYLPGGVPLSLPRYINNSPSQPPLPSRLGRLPAAAGSGFVPDKQRFLPVRQQSTVLTGNLPEQGTDVKAKTNKKRERNWTDEETRTFLLI